MTSVLIYELQDSGYTEIGRVTLADSGAAIVEPEDARQILAGFYVPDLNDPSWRRLDPSDGAAYLEMLPRALNGTYLRAVPAR